LDVLGNTSNAVVGGIARHNCQTLKSYMQAAGFGSYAGVWWRFELIDASFNRDGFDFQVLVSPNEKHQH
jgi:D-alanyl-D-alanine dipeptidase